MAIVLKADRLKTAKRLAKQSGEKCKGWKKSDLSSICWSTRNEKP